MNPSTSFAEDTPASRSARPESAPVPQTSAIFGLNSLGSLAYLDLDTCCWKTCQATFLSDLETYSEIWPDSGMMRNGVVYELQTSAPVICENESSLWPTASASVSNDGETQESWERRRVRNLEKRINGNGMGVPLTIAATQWPTARQQWPTPDTGHSISGHGMRGSTSCHQRTIAEQAEHWLTPHGMGNRDASGKLGGAGRGEFGKQANHWSSSGTGSAPDAGNRGKPSKAAPESLPLFPVQDVEPTSPPIAESSPANLWGTPTTRDHKDGACQDADVPTNSLLGREVTRWPTPTESTATIKDMEQARYAHNDPNRPKYADATRWQTPTQGDSKGRTYQYDQHDKTKPRLSLEGTAMAFPTSPPALRIPDGPPSSESVPTSHQRLNPRFVEWLMGFPKGWTEL